MQTEAPIVTLAMEDMAILRLQEVLFRTGLGRSTLYEMIAKGDFPHPISISMRSVGWVEGEILEWIMSRVANHRKGSSTGAEDTDNAFIFDKGSKRRKA